MYYNRRIYDIASKYHHRLISFEEALALCKGREEEFFSALQDIGELVQNMKQYYIMKNTGNMYYSIKSIEEFRKSLKKIHDNINMGDIVELDNGTAKMINKILNNKELRLSLQAAKLDYAVNNTISKARIGKTIIPEYFTGASMAEPTTPTMDRSIELYYEYVGKGDKEKAIAMYNIITYKSDEN